MLSLTSGVTVMSMVTLMSVFLVMIMFDCSQNVNVILADVNEKCSRGKSFFEPLRDLKHSPNLKKFCLFSFLKDRPAPVTYVPPAPSESEEEMFRSIERGINFDKYDEIPVEVTGRGKEAITPLRTFRDANLYETFQMNVDKANYTKPTPVQKYAIPTIMMGRDLMACAQTGSGKTVKG